MKLFGFILLITLYALLSGGCRHCPPLEAGMAGVEVQVVAEPKLGLRREGSDDYTPTGPDDPFVRLNYRSIPGIVVWVEPVDQSARLPAPSDGISTIALQELRGPVPPAIQGVSVGSRLVFQNKSDRPQAVYSVSDGNEFDLGIVSPGQLAEYIVRSPGLIEVLFESMQQPVARLYAVPSPWVRTMQSNETACIAGVRPGNYRVACWHERLPGSQQPVSLAPETWSNVTVKVSVNLLPAFSNSAK
jgi:hypothetical protein